MEPLYVEIIGFIAASLSSMSFLPQVIKTIKTKNTSGISLEMYIIFICGILFWMAYGILIERYIIVGANIITLSSSFTILFVKIKNVRNGIDK